MDQENAEADFAHPDEVRVAETGFGVRAVEAAKQDEGTTDGTPIAREFGFGFEEGEAEAIEVRAPDCPSDVFFGVAGDNAASKDDDRGDDTGEGAVGEGFRSGRGRGGHIRHELGKENARTDVHAYQCCRSIRSVDAVISDQWRWVDIPSPADQLYR